MAMNTSVLRSRALLGYGLGGTRSQPVRPECSPYKATPGPKLPSRLRRPARGNSQRNRGYTRKKDRVSARFLQPAKRLSAPDACRAEPGSPLIAFGRLNREAARLFSLCLDCVKGCLKLQKHTSGKINIAVHFVCKLHHFLCKIQSRITAFAPKLACSSANFHSG